MDAQTVYVIFVLSLVAFFFVAMIVLTARDATARGLKYGYLIGFLVAITFPLTFSGGMDPWEFFQLTPEAKSRRLKKAARTDMESSN